MIHSSYPLWYLLVVVGFLCMPGNLAFQASGQTPTDQPSTINARRDLFTRQSFVAPEKPDTAALLYRIYCPADAKSNTRLPLVVFLHGAGERGNDNEAQLKHSVHEFVREDRQAKFPCVVIAPQCPGGQKWVEVDWTLTSGKGSFESVEAPVLEQVMALVASLIDSSNVDPSRVYVTGLSMGGYGSWYAAARWSEKIAAVIPVCGGGDTDWASRYQGVPIWTLHGQDDQAVPILRSREMVAAIASAGHAPEIRYTEYPGVAHDSWTQSYLRDDLFEWLFRQRKSH
jgi:predicted peptidase